MSVGCTQQQGIDATRQSVSAAQVSGLKETVRNQIFLSDPVIELRGGTSLSGNIYIDNKHVCDWDWDNREARVACRMLG